MPEPPVGIRSFLTGFDSKVPEAVPASTGVISMEILDLIMKAPLVGAMHTISMAC